MARPRKSLAEARISGAIAKNPQRYRHRSEPGGLGPIGDPLDWLNDHAKIAWKEITSQVPWLNSSHRGHLSITATLYGRLIAGEEVGTQALNLLRLCLSQMGATPADASKVPPPAEEPDEDDLLAEEFFR